MTQHPEREGPPQHIAAQEPLQTIAAFARAVGISTSALRQYGESGLIAPASVEARTGYRYYSLDQQQEAIWIRRLRDAGLSLERIRAVFESDPAAAERILSEWVAYAHDRSASIGALVDDLILSRRAQLGTGSVTRTSVRLDGTVLASAMAQVMSARTDAEEDDGFDGALLEIGSGSAAIVATDRFVLLTRTSIPALVDGPPVRVRFSSSRLREWLRARGDVVLLVETHVGGDGRPALDVRLRDHRGEEVELVVRSDVFPSVHRILAEEPAPAGRVVFRREDVLHLAERSMTSDVALACDGARSTLSSADLTVSGAATAVLPDLRLSGRTLSRIAEASVGPEIVCDVSGHERAVVWRSPSQPDFAALMMPRMA